MEVGKLAYRGYPHMVVIMENGQLQETVFPATIEIIRFENEDSYGWYRGLMPNSKLDDYTWYHPEWVEGLEDLAYGSTDIL